MAQLVQSRIRSLETGDELGLPGVHLIGILYGVADETGVQMEEEHFCLDLKAPLHRFARRSEADMLLVGPPTLQDRSVFSSTATGSFRCTARSASDGGGRSIRLGGCLWCSTTIPPAESHRLDSNGRLGSRADICSEVSGTSKRQMLHAHRVFDLVNE